MKFSIHFLPARYGDSIWIEYGEPDNLKYILIDGGTGGTRKHINQMIDKIPGDNKTLELLVVTHIDKDHIEGILSFLEQPELGITINEIWFNGWCHLPGNPAIEHFGAVQGERLTEAILQKGISWNKRFDNGPAVLPHDNSVLSIRLSGGMELFLLSPSGENLANLKPVWDKEVREAGLDPGFGLAAVLAPDDGVEPFGDGSPDIEKLADTEFHEDEAAANGSSIAFMAEYGNKRVLFAGDAFPGVILDSLNRIYGNGKVPVDLFKLSHHASAHITSPELLKKVKCKTFLISTNGSIYKHPSRETIARVIKTAGKKTKLYFNYRTKYNEIWDDDLLKDEYGYETIFPTGEGIAVHLI